MDQKLKESWHGLYQVCERINAVDYRVELGRGRKKVLHINNLKKYHSREDVVLRLTVVADDFSDDECKSLKLLGECDGFNKEELEEVLGQFDQVFSESPGLTDVCELQIDTGEARTIALPPYHIPEKMREGVRDEVGKMLKEEIIEENRGPWSAPVVPVPKPNGSVRVCIDYRRLNEVTVGDPYYMATLDDILERVGASCVLSKLDLAKGYYQIPVARDSIEKTAFSTPFWKYAFNRMPFGLKNAPAIFQRAMEVVLREQYEHAAPYIDDILVFCMSWEGHVNHLKGILSALDQRGLKVKREKCEFGRRYVEYLGHVVGEGQLAVPEHRATAMLKFQQPRTKKQLRSFLGAMSYYRRFIPSYANYSSHLSPATSKKAAGIVQWTKDMLQAFHDLKATMSNICKLTIPLPTDTFTLHTDASGAGIGATLNVTRDGKEVPVAFYGKQLQGAQRRYSSTELECLAILKLFTTLHIFCLAVRS